LTGGASANTLDATAFTGPVYLFGLAGNDVLRGGTKNDILVGGDDNDTVTGGKGRDLLIGGLGADLLDGGNGDDILIGGATAFDNSVTNLDLVMKEWSRTTVGYRGRVNHLMGTTTGGKNGTVFLNSTTVSNDLAVDNLTGGKNVDWFLTSAGDVVTDPTGTEINTVVP
jgi:Ca2+-binding RTX toxin-like protein